MKRHKYKFPRYIKDFTKKKELQILAFKFIREQQLLTNPSIVFGVKNNLKETNTRCSKINTYCLVTGRPRYTLKDTQTSRHIFFEYCREGFLPGYFFS